MLFSPRIPLYVSRFVFSSVVAPHGLTDYLHASSTRNMKALVALYTTSCGCNFILPARLDNIMFLLLSVAHFRHDLGSYDPTLKSIHRWIYSGLVVFCLQGAPFQYDLLTFYMTCIHVPLHYERHIQRAEIYKPFLFLWLILYGATAGATYICFETFFNSNEFTTNTITLVRGIIMAHILYEEKYVNNK